MKKTFVFVVPIFLSLVSLRAAERWQPLWDGKTFQGWHVIGKGEWKIEDGAIHAKHELAQRRRVPGHFGFVLKVISKNQCAIAIAPCKVFPKGMELRRQRHQ